LEAERQRQAALDDMIALGIDPRETYSPENLAETMTDWSWADDPNLTLEDISGQKIMDAIQTYIAFNPDRVAPGAEPIASEATTPTEPTSDYINSLTGKDVQAAVRDAGNVFGSVLDDIVSVFGIPPPDYAVLQPNAPGGTIVWGEPSGSVFGKVGTTPGGTTVGVQTGIPVLDVIIGKAADIAVGRAQAGDVIGTQDVWDILKETAAGELDLPPGVSGTQVMDVVGEVVKESADRKLGVDMSGDTDRPRAPEPTPMPDSAPTEVITDTVPSDYVPSDRITATDIVLGGIPTDMNEPPPETPADETPADETPETPGGGGGGGGGGGTGGYGQGIRVVQGAPGPSVDIDYLYDIGGESIFGPTIVKPKKDEDKNRPYVYKKTGGMIGTYDPVAEAIRLLTGG